MAPSVRIQVCGPLVVRIGGADASSALPGGQGRLLLAWLALHRTRESDRSELVSLLWPDPVPETAATSLRALLSKLRRAIGDELLPSSAAVRLTLPPDAWIDIEAARSAAHDAESAAALGDHRRAWVAAHVAMNVAGRAFLPAVDHPWADSVRRELAELRMRSLEALAMAGLGLGGPELATATRAAGELVATDPLRETGQSLLVLSLVAAGNPAQALVAYEDARRQLADQLGTAPGPGLRAAHARALAAGSGN